MLLWHKAVQVALAANVPVLIQGDPGIGKTSFINALAAARRARPEVIIASLREPSDFLGLPIAHTDGSVMMAPPVWAKRLAEAGDDGILILDEITTAPPAVQAALLRVVLERVVGDLALPPGVRVIAIANAADQVGGWELSLPLSNRFFHLHAGAPSAQEWAIGLQDGWTTPPKMPNYEANEESASKARALVGGFLATRPSLLLSVPKQDAQERAAWPSPRSWAMATQLLAVGLPTENAELNTTILAGTVGPGAANEFMIWMKSLDLPDPAELLAKPAKFKVPNRIDKVFVILDGVATYATQRIPNLDFAPADAMWQAAWQVIQKVVEADMTDVALLAAKKLAGVRREKFTLPHGTLDSFRELISGLA